MLHGGEERSYLAAEMDLLGGQMRASGQHMGGVSVEELDLGAAGDASVVDDAANFARAAFGVVASEAPSSHHIHHHHHHQQQQQRHQQHEQQQQQQQQIVDGSSSSQELSVAHLLSDKPRKKKKVVKKWRDEWADTYKWACVQTVEGSARIFCTVCKEYGRKHRRNPYGNEGSRNMQMSALEEHNNSLLHKEALRLQLASKDKGITLLERPIYIKAVLSKSAESIVEAIIRRDPHDSEYIQAVQEIVHSLEPVLSKNIQYIHVLESLLEPERVIMFRVPWVDDKGEKHISRGFRVQFNQALGPYKGGLRFHPSVNLSILKFLGLEQTLKNALSTFSFGGAEGGSDFDPKGKSDAEVMRFCQSFMDELFHHIGPNQDTLDGDIGVGFRELGYLYGQYRRLTGEFECALSGGRNMLANSNLHAEAAGHGLVYYAKHVLADLDKDIKGLRCLISGFGKLSMHVAEKLIAVGATPISLSDSRGYLLDEEGIDGSKLMFLKEMKSQQKPLRDYPRRYLRAKYFDDARPWGEKCDLAFPCATQNELNHSDATAIVASGCQVIVEGSDMPCTAEAVDVLKKSKIVIAPSKAANAGGIAVSGLEMASKSNQIHWSAEDVDNKLQELMRDIYQKSITAAVACGHVKGSPDCLVHGANVAGFLRLAQAMLEQGWV